MRAPSLVRRLLRPRPASKPEEDPFGRFRSLEGPVLAGGPAVAHDPHLDGAGRLVVLLPHLTLERMSGGPNTIFHVTARLVREGIPLRYVGTFGPLAPDAEALRAHIATVTGVNLDAGDVELLDASARGSVIGVGVDDVLLATWWPTAHVALRGLPFVRAREFIYLVQDFEPGFYAWSTKYALAAATYAMPVRTVVNERLLFDHLVQSGVGTFSEPSRSKVFTPAVDRSVFKARAPRLAGRRRLAFYARPRNPRNLFELGLRALRVAIAEGVFDASDWEFCGIGQALVDLPLSERHTLQATPWMPYEAYAAFLGQTDVLLSLMLSPHTSYPPLEMAATGGRTVTNTFGAKTAEALASISPLIHAVTPSVDELVAGLRASVDDLGAPAHDVQPAIPASWDAALADVTPWLADTITELRTG